MDWKKLERLTVPGALAGAMSVLGARAAHADWELNMPVGVTPISREVYDLHMLILWICVWIGVVVFGAMFWAMWHHRKSRGALPAQFHHSTTAEVVWTIIPFLILVGMAIPATKTLVAMEDTSNEELTIKVTGYQWKWRYDYLDEGFHLYSNLAPASRAAIYRDPTQVENYLLDVDNPIVVPVDTKVRFLLTSDDVIHAWWVPEFGQKKDAIPGYVNEIWVTVEEEGVYRGQCAELCGKDHGFMPIVVVATSEEKYREWVTAHVGEQEQATAQAAADETRTDWTQEELMARGEEVYDAHCVACHQTEGQGVPGTFPAIAGSPVATGPVADHLSLVLKGRAGTAMAPFGGQLNNAELAAVITYQRNAFGNDTGDVVMPSDVAAAR